MATNNQLQTDIASEFDLLTKPVGPGKSRGVGPTIGEEAMEVFAFDLEQRHNLAEIRVGLQGIEAEPKADTSTPQDSSDKAELIAKQLLEQPVKKPKRKRVKRKQKKAKQQIDPTIEKPQSLTTKQQEIAARMARQKISNNSSKQKEDK